MANFGTGYVNIVPKFPGFKAAVEAELGKVNPKQQGQKFGDQFSTGATGGLVKSGAIVGAFATITNQAMSSVANHVGAAITRFDTLNNYPKVMQSLGYSAEDAESSISKMSDRLQSLPTTLDSMVSLTQGLVTMTGDLGKATDAGLALNDMLVASGSSQQLVTAAMEQFRQMLSKGKPEMEDWRSLTTAMPGQMDQLAKSMLGPTANANDLYAALGGGNNEATISMDQLLDEMIRLDTEGGASFSSFQEQAETAAGGVQTSLANMGNAITKGITGVMDEIGSENISGVFNDAKGAINEVFSILQDGVGVAVPVLKNIYEAAKPLVPTIAAVATAFVGLNKAAPIATGLAGGVKSLFEAFQLAKGGAGTFAESLAAVGFKINPVGIVLGIAATAVGLLATAAIDAAKKQENLEKATTGLNDAVSDVTSLGDYAGVISDISGASERSAMSLDELNASFADHADAIKGYAEEAQEQIGELNTAQSIINQYAGATDLSADAQGRLQWAIQQINDQFGLSITAADVAANSYVDQSGKTQVLTDSINNLIETKKREIEMDALSSTYAESLQMQKEAADSYAEALENKSNRIQEVAQQIMSMDAGITYEQATAAATQQVNGELEEQKKRLDDANSSIKSVETEMGDLAKSTSESADAFDDWGNKANDATGGLLNSLLSEKGGLAGFKDDLRSLEADTGDLSKLTSDQLQELALAYDGTSASIISKLQEWGVGMNEAAISTAQGAQTIKDALNSLGEDLTNAFSESGIDIDAFSQKLSEAGVSTEQLNSIGSENLSALAQSCQGNTDMMVWAIENWNNVPMVDKDGNVTVDDESLIDAQGNVWTWNGTTFVDKNGNAIVNDTSLRDAQGRLYTWNGSSLVPHTGSGNIFGNLQSAIGWQSTWNSGGLKSFWANASVAITETINRVAGNASGGVIRKHADGFIATRPTMIGPNDMIGEAGAEAYVNAGGHDYIVPLTNRRYSQPFIDLLAQGVREQFGNAGNVYQFGDINIKADQLKDLQTIDDFVNKVIRVKGAR